uniref:C-type lectin domain-containing protein n=1 Tax=Sinocyclocheilus rhinocerous TaxID=307959 RepID=A0A673J609_9TELE
MNCTDAQRYCRENYSDLASIDNSADVTELLKIVTKSADYAVWIGLMETLRSEWKWSQGDPGHFLIFSSHADSSKGFVLVQQSMSWRNAQSFCRANHMDLSSVRSQSENQQIQQLINTGVWIGLFRDSWEWSDKSTSSFRNWAPTEPHSNENATVLVKSGSRTGQWEDWPCNSQFTFVCQKGESMLGLACVK